MPSITFSNAVSQGSRHGAWKHDAAIGAGADDFFAGEDHAAAR